MNPLNPVHPSRFYDCAFATATCDDILAVSLRFCRSAITVLWTVTALLLSTTANAQSSGLIAYYPFSGSAQDVSGHSHHGQVFGATLTQDRFGVDDSAYAFDGNDYISIPFDDEFSFEPEGQFTLSAWIKADSLDFSHDIITKSPANDHWDYGLDITYEKFLFGRHNQSVAYSTTIVQPDIWYFAAGVYSNRTWEIYVDGRLEQSVVQATQITQSSGGLSIGRKGDYSRDYFLGVIDDVRIYDRALTAEQVHAIFLGNAIPEPSSIVLAVAASMGLLLRWSLSTAMSA